MQARLANPADRDALAAFHGQGFGPLPAEAARDGGAADVLLVLEDAQGVLAGYALLRSPSLAAHFRRGVSVRRVPLAGIDRKLATLTLCNDLCDAARLCALRVAGEGDPAAAAAAVLLGAVQETARREAARFGRRLYAALPGVQGADGDAVLWQALGRHFAAQGQAHLDGDAAALAELLPQHTLYAGFLPAPARAVLGVAGDACRDVQGWLHAAGWQASDYVDPFDGGPVLLWPDGGAGR
ncbi:arginine N-succinyltransferase [Crenobacter caeni]|uniref:Arginine N-succinyltransferase n=1 Tax=Crenobacter caeni TaxID=2705474 RepID=A0A6B2KRW4_9NEIS|nr:arginine N-succinyltransferase [Crenobacter caeni]NDV12687.1 arginine N-succinyltransferase [Crenobacter caeni]